MVLLEPAVEVMTWFKVFLEELGNRTQKDSLGGGLLIRIRGYILSVASVLHWKPSAEPLGYSRLPAFTSLHMHYLYLF